METSPRFPEIRVRLTGKNGNALVLISTVIRALRRQGIDSASIKELSRDATSGDDNHVLQTCMVWVSVTEKERTP